MTKNIAKNKRQDPKGGKEFQMDYFVQVKALDIKVREKCYFKQK